MSTTQKNRSRSSPKTKNASRKSEPASTAVPQVATASTPLPPDDQLTAWLTERATTFKTLEVEGNKLKLDFVENSRAKGEILLEVRERLSTTSTTFRNWVAENTDIGYSTALLWIDLATNFDAVKERFTDSNPLELTVREVRDAIRDARQKNGGGKPGSGKTKAISPIEPDAADADEDESPEAAEDDAVEIAEGTDADTAKWEREASKAEAESAELDQGGKSEVQYPVYKMMVIVKTEADQMAIYRALSKWSPISKTSLGAKQVRSVTAHSRPEDIATLLDTLGKSLAEQQPKAVRVSIEL